MRKSFGKDTKKGITYKEKKEAVDNGTMSLKEFKDWLNSY